MSTEQPGKNNNLISVVVLGASGMTGHVLVDYLNFTGMYKVTGIGRKSEAHVSVVIDVLNFPVLENFLRREKPDLVINSIGVLNKAADTEPSRAILLNSYLPHFLSDCARDVGFKLMHISSDCVFSGNKGNYLEKDFCDGNTIYARSKFLGELDNTNDLTIRTSLIGPELSSSHGIGLLNWYLMQKTCVEGYSNVFWSGVTTLQFAKEVDRYYRKNISGLIHLAPVNKISKFELLQIISDVFNVELPISKNDFIHIDKSLLSSRTDIDNSTLDYYTMVYELFDWMNRFPQFYKHYQY